jgi:hypothetical protein
MTLLFKTWIFIPKSSNEDNLQPSRMLSSHVQPQTPKPGKPGLGGLGYFEIGLFH